MKKSKAKVEVQENSTEAQVAEQAAPQVDKAPRHIITNGNYIFMFDNMQLRLTSSEITSLELFSGGLYGLTLTHTAIKLLGKFKCFEVVNIPNVGEMLVLHLDAVEPDVVEFAVKRYNAVVQQIAKQREVASTPVEGGGEDVKAETPTPKKKAKSKK